MILPIILLILVFLVLAILIMFIFFMLFPSIKKNNDENNFSEDPLISQDIKENILTKNEELSQNNQKALVLCSCNKKFQIEPLIFNKEHSCFMIKSIHDSGSDCKYACIGLGDCTKVCPQNAISIINRTAVVSKLCIGCGKCVEICPQNIIKLVPNDIKSLKLCNNTDECLLSSCSEQNKVQNVEWKDKKDFKLWSSCYKIFKKWL